MVAGELLLVVPTGKLRPFGVAVVAYCDDRPSGLQMFVGRRDNEAGRQWMLLDRAAKPAWRSPRLRRHIDQIVQEQRGRKPAPYVR
jgi:hypothetical protein